MPSRTQGSLVVVQAKRRLTRTTLRGRLTPVNLVPDGGAVNLVPDGGAVNLVHDGGANLVPDGEPGS